MRGTPRLGWLALVAVAAAAFSGLALAPAFSSSLDPMLKTKGLTKAKAKKLFYTKQASDSRYYSKADSDSRYYSKADSDSRYYSKADSDSRYLPSDGATVLQASPLTWQQILGASPVTVQRGSDGIFLQSGVAATAAVVISPTMPTELAGEQMRLMRVNACYTTPSGSTVTAAKVHLVSNTNGLPNQTTPAEDTTPRTDNACRDYTLPAPVLVGPSDYVTFEFDVSLDAGGGSAFGAGRATFYLEPQ